jgi:hypothetical protein
MLMDRLRSLHASSDRVLAAAARLVLARPSLGYDPTRKQRVRARLAQRRRTSRAVGLVRLAMFLFVLCSFAAASAMIGHAAGTIRARIVEHRRKRAAAAQERAHHVALAPVAASAAPPPVAEPDVAAVAPVAAAAPRVAVPSAVRAKAPSRAKLEHTTHAPPAAPPLENQLLVEGVRALRNDHDSARAADLLTLYLDLDPDGVAAEDAFALAIEATITRDVARASSLATRYLARYPHGRWASLARRVLAP